MKTLKRLFLFSMIGAAAIALMHHANAANTYNYGEALSKATAWYDANRCGTDVATDNVFSSWRSACHTSDLVNGGFHDAGDHVKFGLPAAFSASMMGWSYYEFASEYESAGAKAKLLQELKIFSDYFLNCWNGTSFVYQIGEGGSDHSYWGPPETQTTSRPAYSASSSSAASDVCGQTAGALALMAINYQAIDATYAAKCLTTAKALFDLGKSNLGLSTAAGSYYQTTSYLDDLCWGGIWLYLATQDSSYLTQVTKWLDSRNSLNVAWSICWDECTVANVLMMYKITGQPKYYEALIYNFDWFKNSTNKTPDGLPYLADWGSLRYVSAEAGLIYIANKEFGISKYNSLANFMIDYCLGSNPKGLSYITNYGSNAVKHPHHRANEPVMYGETKGMVGALVGGPTSSDGYNDDVGQYVYAEVALDYNASFLLGCAGRYHLALVENGGTPSPSPSATATGSLEPTVTPSPSASPTATTSPAVTGKYSVTYTQNDWGGGATVTISIKNNSNSAINGWILSWSFSGNQNITNLWDGTYTQSGKDVAVSNHSYNGVIAAGGSTTFGFNLSYSGVNAKPNAFTLNDTACTVQ